MSRETADLLWGPVEVAAALAAPADVSLNAAERALLVRYAHELSEDGFARWAREQPRPLFCAVVRLVCGDEAEMMKNAGGN